ncbi:2Fe-2S iron-sulfur cluster-binding protein [Burkholderia vietnamiensis]|jgi:ferredoxin|uniref:Ferredoxin n=3 Tax=Burkholderia cepacia complex TaxID=87882 RepID=A4JNN2_BURVG|nr:MULTISPECIES: 2Fe-2S iron-sulfur cluster-binding protein [Burkholderia]ABO57885.1 ferredoxin [Burkholderia vietnamiensis G4]AFJ88643.1 Ferredoxin [Burkholderia sp. KJ006]AJY03648.1 2Fe-2S iron-sulfur cluster binding domain protein [Burkholderia vietnamiensis LMG 10929]AOJ78199.1 ferredoxin [Burkholderia ubonensis]AOJ98597.1 ferredoxin [Burkholderia vietnamiensis]
MHTVIISTTGESFALPHDAYLSDAAELQLGGLTFGCRAGMCGICVIEVLAGMDNLSHPEDKESTFLEWLGHDHGDKRLACQCRLRGDVTIRQC